jgi:hypothetical protein
VVKILCASSSTPAQVINTRYPHNFFGLFIAQNILRTRANKIKVNMIQRALADARHGVVEGHRASDSAVNFPELYANWANHASKDAVE